MMPIFFMKKRFAKIFILGLFPFLTFFSVEWVLESFPLNEPDIVLATLWAPKTGFVFFWIEKFFIAALLPSIVLASVLTAIQSRLKRVRNFLLPGLYLLVAINIFDLIYFEHEVPILEYVQMIKSNHVSELKNSAFLQRELVSPQVVQEPVKKRNLVLIFLESMEKNYGSYIPELTSLANQNQSFASEGDGGLETFATTGTLNSTIAKVLGVPQLDLFHAMYFPRVPSIYSFLKKYGYTNFFIQGTSAKFANFDSFLKENKVDYVYDVDNFLGQKYNYDGFDYVSDKKILKYSQKIFREQSSKGPFSLSIATIETHYPNGFYNDDCMEKPVDGSSSARYQTVLKCSSKEISEFVNWIQQQDSYNRTTIILVGDHLFKGKSLANDDTPVRMRSWYNTFINVDESKRNVRTNRLFTSFDIAPSIMESLGFELNLHRMGIGVSLFSENQETIVERIGLDSLNKELRQMKNTVEYQSLYFQKKQPGFD